MNKDRIFCAMFGFSKLSSIQKHVIDCLYHSGAFYGGYTDFTVSLYRHKKQVSNVRKALILLEEKGIVEIKRGSGGKAYCFNLLPNWMEKLQ